MQVFLAVEWLVDNVNPKFVLKTDDDAYVDTAHMVTALKELCQQPNCEDERCAIYIQARLKHNLPFSMLTSVSLLSS